MNELTYQFDQEVSLSESKLRRRVPRFDALLESGGEMPSKSVAVEECSSRRRPLSGGGGMNERRGRPIAKPVTCGLNARLKPSPLVMSRSGVFRKADEILGTSEEMINNDDEEEASDNDDADTRSSSSEASLHSKHTLDSDVIAAIEAIRSRRSKIADDAIELIQSRSKITVDSASSSPTSVATNLDEDRIVPPASIRRHPKGRSKKLQPINEEGGSINEEVAPIYEVKVSKARRRRRRSCTLSQEVHRPREYNEWNDDSISELWIDNMTVAMSTMSDDITRQGSSSSSEASSEDDCSSKDLSSQDNDDDDEYSDEDDEDYSYTTTVSKFNIWSCSFIRDLRDTIRYLNSNQRRR